ncbi:HD-GYP domain-containing protein [Caldichromatium japonicum]|uniref:HD-GYP domain-containing protein n=1 Tax=Caldichromatium japonicum TaxID=2699430 RepID=A0A6G7VBG6_9GAMM|nr:HD-GYP domain-containing protein [Caldichromatium japonicum]QIK37250.1 HD-GYP domain-containing protein [Caldichromatium japonicum]
MNERRFDKDELRIGMFVMLDLPWLSHPFLTNSFKIRNQHQINILRQLDLETIRVDLDRSDPFWAQDQSDSPAADALADEAGGQAFTSKLWSEKHTRIQQLKERRARLNQCAKCYLQKANLARSIMSHLRSAPAQAAEEAVELVGGMVDELTEDPETTVQLVNLKHRDENSYNHAVNVSALALVLGREFDLDQAQLRLLGMGALFHDLGHLKIPSQILMKKGPLTEAERRFYQQHPRYGAEIARQIGTLPAGVIEIIVKHHEHMDGSGFPEGLSARDLGLLTRILTVVNRYDNLCNGFGSERDLSPHQAISRMYSKERQWYDPKVLTTFITHLGVYPPGTVVRLNDGRIAVVTSINTEDLLKPNVLVYSEEIPAEEALILNLIEEEIGIRESLKISELTQAQIEYLNLSDKLSYYFQGQRHGRVR